MLAALLAQPYFHQKRTMSHQLVQLLKNTNTTAATTDAAYALSEHERLLQVMRHHDVNCKSLGDRLQSVNFADRAFYKARWDDLSIQARGLFVEEAFNAKVGRKLMRVCGRSYRKFFYQDERGVTYMQRENLPSLIKFPMEAFVKENGYLGILFARVGENGEPYLQPASKSTIKGDFAENFSQMLRDHLSKHKIDPRELASVLHDGNVSIVFEVIHPTFDPHIIRYKEPHMVLLECINNCITTFGTQPFDNLRAIAEHFHFPIKVHVGTLNSMADYDRLHERLTQDENYRVQGELVEGLVLEDTEKFMVKAKSIYYNNWKRIRGIKEVIRRGKNVHYNANEHATVMQATRWLQQPAHRKFLDKDIITIRSVFLGELDETTAMQQPAERSSNHSGDEDDKAGPSAPAALEQDTSPLGAKLRNVKVLLHKEPVCVVVTGPPFAGQDQLVQQLATKLDGVVLELDNNIKARLTSSYAKGKPVFMHANEVTAAKFWPAVAKIGDPIHYRFVGVVMEPSDELPLVCIKRFLATTTMEDEPKGKDTKNEQNMHHAILRSCKRLEDVLADPSAESILSVFLNNAFPTGFARLQILPDSVKKISPETEAVIQASKTVNDVDIRDDIINDVLPTDDLLGLIADSLVPALATKPAVAVGGLAPTRVSHLIQLARDSIFHGRGVQLSRLLNDTERRFAMWLTIVGFRHNEALRTNSADELYAAFGRGALPPVNPGSPVVIVLVGMPGLGKSFVSELLARTLGIARVCQDEEGDRTKFLAAALREIKKTGIVIADRNNHTASHRHAVIEAIKKKMPSATVVCMSFSVWDMKSAIALCTERIRTRGEKHPSLRASSDYTQVLQRFSSSYQAPVFASRAPEKIAEWQVPASNEDSDYLIDFMIDVDPRESEVPKLTKIVTALHEAIGTHRVGNVFMNLDHALSLVLSASVSSSPSASASSPGKSVSPVSASLKGLTLAQYYGFHAAESASINKIKSTIESLPGAHPLSKYANTNPLLGGPHVTVLFTGGRLPQSDLALFELIKGSLGMPLTIKATHLLQNDIGMCLAVSLPKEFVDERRAALSSSNPSAPAYHFTLATNGKPVYSNDMVESAFFIPGNPERVQIIPIVPPLEISTTLSSF